MENGKQGESRKGGGKQGKLLRKLWRGTRRKYIIKLKSEKYTYITIQRDGEGSYIQQPLELIVENKCKKFFVCDVVGIREEQGWWQGKFGTVVNQWK